MPFISDCYECTCVENKNPVAHVCNLKLRKKYCAPSIKHIHERVASNYTVTSIWYFTLSYMFKGLTFIMLKWNALYMLCKTFSLLPASIGVLFAKYISIRTFKNADHIYKTTSLVCGCIVGSFGAISVLALVKGAYGFFWLVFLYPTFIWSFRLYQVYIVWKVKNTSGMTNIHYQQVARFSKRAPIHDYGSGTFKFQKYGRKINKEGRISKFTISCSVQIS